VLLPAVTGRPVTESLKPDEVKYALGPVQYQKPDINGSAWISTPTKAVVGTVMLVCEFQLIPSGVMKGMAVTDGTQPSAGRIVRLKAVLTL